MPPRLKPLRDQVAVITSAPSGLGLVPARMVAELGARVVLAARSEDALPEREKETTRKGGKAIQVGTDVGREEDVAAIALKAAEAFGGFGTWVNDASVGVTARWKPSRSGTCSARSRLLARPAVISRLDVLASKSG